MTIPGWLHTFAVKKVAVQVQFWLFLDACRTYRSEVGWEMLQTRGLNHHSITTETSVHNQRINIIERPKTYCGEVFGYLFNYLDVNLLEPLNDRRLFALHYVYLERNDNILKKITLQCNHCPVRPEHNL